MNQACIPALLAAIAVCGCSIPGGDPTELIGVAMIDITDTLERVTIDDVKNAAGWTDPHPARTFRVRPIMDVDQVPTGEVRSPAWNNVGDPSTWSATTNEFYRGQSLEHFWDSIRSAIDTVYAGPIKLNHTSLLVPLCEELEYLQSHPDADRFLIIGSDLGQFDNTRRGGLDFIHDSTTLAWMDADSLCIWERVEGSEKLFDLEGVRVVILYEAGDNAENARYRVIAGYLRRRLESLGAEVQLTGKISTVEVG